MSVTTLDGIASGGTPVLSVVGRGFTRLVEAMVEARIRQAEPYIRAYHAQLDDKTLALAGLTRGDLTVSPFRRPRA